VKEHGSIDYHYFHSTKTTTLFNEQTMEEDQESNITITILSSFQNHNDDDDNNDDDDVAEEHTGNMLDDYSSIEVVLWLVLVLLGIAVAYYFRSSIVRHMEQRIPTTRTATVRSSRSLQGTATNGNNNNSSSSNSSANDSRKNFLDKSLTSFTWSSSSNNNNNNTSTTTSSRQESNSELMTMEHRKGFEKMVHIGGSSIEKQVVSVSKTESNVNNDKNDNKSNILEKNIKITDECIICLTNMIDGQRVTKSNNPKCCSRIFHYDCAYEWLLQHVKCPICRQEFVLPDDYNYYQYHSCSGNF